MAEVPELAAILEAALARLREAGVVLVEGDVAIRLAVAIEAERAHSYACPHRFLEDSGRHYLAEVHDILGQIDVDREKLHDRSPKFRGTR
jgi:hypothetical protein